MKCQHCGADMPMGANFCASCGQSLANTNNIVNNQNPLDNSQYGQPAYVNQYGNQYGTTPPKQTSTAKIILLIIGIIVFLSIAVFIVLVIIGFAVSSKLVCKSPQGDITIIYTDDAIIGYTSSGITYDLNKQQEYAKLIGIDAYIEEFSEWFSTNTSGSCTK